MKIKRLAGLITACVLLVASPITAGAGGLTEINAATFRGNTRITSVHIGSDVSEITPGAFRNLMALKSITVSENNPFYASYSNCLYNKDLTELICFPAALTGAMIPDTAVSIGENALHGLGDGLKSQIRAVIESQAKGNLKESDVPGAHFIHTEYGLKWKSNDGTIKQPDTELMKLTASVVEAATTGDMTQQKQLERCFNYFVNMASYERSYDLPTGNWTEQYATDILKTGKGNCYNYAAGFAYIARSLGYDARVCAGTVSSSLGGRTAHAWTEVKVGDTWYIYDAEMQGAKGSGYYKQTYESYPAGPLEKNSTWTVFF